MSEEKKAIVRDLGFAGLMHISPLRVHYKLLKELANSFKLGKNTLEIGYGSFRVKPSTIWAALGLNTSAPIFKMDKIKEGNWGAHVLNFIIKCITNYTLKKKKSIDGYLFVLMIVYFHLSTKKEKKGEERTAQPWIANCNREQLVERMRAEMDEYMNCEDDRNKGEIETNKKKKKQKKKASSSSSKSETTESEVYFTSEFETEEDSEEPKRKQPTRTVKKIESKKRKKIQEDSDSETESNDESEESSPVEKQKTKKKTQRTPQKTQSKRKKLIVEDSSPEQTQSYHGSEIGTEELEEFLRESKKKKNNEKSTAQGENGANLRSTEGHYDSSEIIPEVNLGSDEPLSQAHTDQSSINKPAESMLSLVEESANEPAEENMIVVREETQSQTEALSIVPIQVYLPLSQRNPVPEIEQTPVPDIQLTPAKSPSEKFNEETIKNTPEPPPKTKESTLTLPPAPSALQNHRQKLKKAHSRFHQLHLNNNPTPEDAAALMMMAQTASYIPKEGQAQYSLKSLYQTTGLAWPVKSKVWPGLTWPVFIPSLGLTDSRQEEVATQEEGKTPQIQKQSEEESFEKFETPARTNEMTTEMKEKCYIWATRVKTYADGATNEYDAMCTLNAQDRYILSKIHFASLKDDTHIEAENMTIENHPKGEFLQPKTNKPFRVEDYQIMRVYARGAPLKRKDQEIHPPYMNISGQKTSYDCAIYVMKWLDIIQPENVKRGKYEWDNWTQDEVNHYIVEYASRILFNEMNHDKVEAIRGVMQ
ncbi:uncharacterized protein DS421_3g69590 [Arachis hypogaea]|nr:uncharacterized protein DS421_3g69590 [Arachis hypogaea]